MQMGADVVTGSLCSCVELKYMHFRVEGSCLLPQYDLCSREKGSVKRGGKDRRKREREGRREKPFEK